MPIDGHAYLVSQGWQGRGSGLRNGSISRPVIIAQKKNMAGIGKDRDEAFPFWDHVFTTAASSIKIKVYDSDSEDTESSTPAVTFQKTSTGIISNRRPTTGTPALSGTATPMEGSSSSSGSSTPRMSVMAAAKQQAARRTLYSMFFRGPILGSDFEETTGQTQDTTTITEENVKGVESAMKSGKKDKGKKRKRENEEEGEAGGKTGEGKQVKHDGAGEQPESAAERNERSSKEKSKKRKRTGEVEIVADDSLVEDEEARRLRKAEKAERKRLKAEKRARKEEKRRLKEARSGTVAMHSQEIAEVEAEDVVDEIPTQADEGSRSRKGSNSKKKRKSKDVPDISSA